MRHDAEYREGPLTGGGDATAAARAGDAPDEGAGAPGPEPADTPTARLELILGAEGLARVQAARVLVLGLGGVGSNCVEALARGGVGHLILVDDDVVQPSNINRQAIAYVDTVGMRKTAATRQLVRRINPQARVELIDCFVLPENLPDLLARTGAADGRVDYVVDAIDTISTKIALAEEADRRGFKLISSMGAAMKLHPECLEIVNYDKTSADPVARIMRRELRKRGIKRLKVVSSTERPVAPRVKPAGRGDRSHLGTASFMPPIMGQMIAGEVIRELAGLA